MDRQHPDDQTVWNATKKRVKRKLNSKPHLTNTFSQNENIFNELTILPPIKNSLDDCVVGGVNGVVVANKATSPIKNSLDDCVVGGVNGVVVANKATSPNKTTSPNSLSLLTKLDAFIIVEQLNIKMKDIKEVFEEMQDTIDQMKLLFKDTSNLLLSILANEEKPR